MQTEQHPHWERGYRCHGYWLGHQRLGRVTLPPRGMFTGEYRCLIDTPLPDTFVATRRTLSSAKNVVERACQRKSPNEKTRLSRYAIGNAAIRVLSTSQWSHMECVAWGEIVLLDEIASQAGLPALHPLNRHKRILDALEHDPRFEKFLFKVWVGNREGHARAFRLKTSQQQADTSVQK